MSDLIGRELGGYRIVEQLGVGGMATVYKAFQPSMNRHVAIKVLPPHMATDAGFRARFQRETEAIARLEHRHILPVYDAGEADGIPYLVMRWSTGGTFSAALRQHSLSLKQIIQIVREVAEALDYAHRNGVIHRDVKPANILLTNDGSALLSDFGIAKIVEGAVNLTSDGMWIGTPAYMAPAQIQGNNNDPRSDIYSLGVVLYEAATGQPPFQAETPFAVAMKHIHDPLPLPRNVSATIPEALEHIILKALAKNPDDRYQTAGEFAQALHNYELGAKASDTLKAAPTTVVLPERDQIPLKPRSLSPWLGLLAAVLVAVLGFAGWKLLSKPSAVTPTTVAVNQVPTSVSSSASVIPSGKSKNISQLAIVNDTVWAATDGGLVRWFGNGTGFVFDAQQGIPFDNGEIQTLAPDPSGGLWLGAGGFAHVDPRGDDLGRIDFYAHDDGHGIRTVKAVLVRRDGSLWIGGNSTDDLPIPIVRFDGNEWQTNVVNDANNVLNGVKVDVWSLFEANDSVLWIGLRDAGMLRWDGSILQRFDLATIPAMTNQPDLRVRRITQSADGTIWAAASARGLLRFDPSQQTWQQVKALDGMVRSVAAFADGNLWVAGDGEAAFSKDNGATWQQTNATPQTLGNDVGSLVQDSKGRVWAGAYDGGISVYDGTAWTRLQP